MRVTVRKWGNNASLRIPAAMTDTTKLSLDQTVNLREERGRIVIEPVRTPAFDLDDLIAGITDKNRHEEIDFGETIDRGAG